jgi:hypothetical protein
MGRACGGAACIEDDTIPRGGAPCLAERTVIRLATVVLNWNRRADTLTCLGSLARQQGVDFEHTVIVVDNGSTDGSPEAIRLAFPTTRVLSLAANGGFAAGMNAGLRAALAQDVDWVLLLNNDTVVDGGLAAALLTAAASDPAIGLATPTVYYFDRPGVVWPSAGKRRPSTLAPRDTTAQPPSSEPYDIDWATGCCLLVRRAVWQDVGLLDEGYRFYYEDHDFCLRVQAAGWRLVHVPRARVWHRVSASTGAGTPLQLYLLARASVRFYAQHSTGPRRAWMAPYRAGSFVHTTWACVRRGQPEAAVAYARGLADGWRDLRRQPTRSLEWILKAYSETN